MNNPVDKHVGVRLREVRALRQKTQTELAEYCGVSFQQIQKYEAGWNRISASRMWQMCQFFAVTPNYFFEGLKHDRFN